MNFDFSEDQKLLKDEAHRFLSDKSQLSIARGILESEGQYDKSLWDDIVRLGWLGVALPEAYGGVGLGYLEQCVIAEELGRVLSPVPFPSTAYLFSQAILLAGDDSQKEFWLSKVIQGECIGTMAYAEGFGFPTSDSLSTIVRNNKLFGKKWPVSDGDIADVCVVLAKNEDNKVVLCVVDMDENGVSVEELNSIDPTKDFSSISFDGADCHILSCGHGWSTFEKVLNIAAVLYSFEQIGGAEACLNAATEFAKERKAFGRVIGSFQAIKHKLADMYVKNELAKSNAYYGAWALSTDSDQLPIAASCARVSAIDAYEYAAKESIQVHGGMGYTWEADCHLYLRRSKSLSTVIGGKYQWKRKITDELEKSL